MSVWHEIQVEFACDAADDMIAAYGMTPELAQIRAKLSEAMDKATDLPEDTQSSVVLLNQSINLLTQAENQLPAGDEARHLRNKIKKAKLANQQTIEDMKSFVSDGKAEKRKLTAKNKPKRNNKY